MGKWPAAATSKSLAAVGYLSTAANHEDLSATFFRRSRPMLTALAALTDHQKAEGVFAAVPMAKAG